MKEFIIALLQEMKPYEDIEERTDLIETGILNSLSIMSLIVSLEEAFEVVIADEMVTAEHFSTISAIENLVLVSKKA